MLYPQGMINLAVSLVIIAAKGVGDGMKFFYKNPVLILLPVVAISGVVYGAQNEAFSKKMEVQIDNLYDVSYQGAVTNLNSVKQAIEESPENSTLYKVRETSNLAVNSTKEFFGSEEFQDAWNGNNSPFKEKAIAGKEIVVRESGETFEYLKSQCYLKVLTEGQKPLNLGEDKDDCFLVIDLVSGINRP